jgi:hypothetical protein
MHARVIISSPLAFQLPRFNFGHVLVVTVCCMAVANDVPTFFFEPDTSGLLWAVRAVERDRDEGDDWFESTSAQSGCVEFTASLHSPTPFAQYSCLHNGCQALRKQGVCALFVRKHRHLDLMYPDNLYAKSCTRKAQGVRCFFFSPSCHSQLPCNTL